VIAWEELPLSGMSAEQINAILATTDFAWAAPVAYGARNFRLRYLTQDRGRLVEATAAVGIPQGLPAGEAAAPLLWLHGTSGFNDQCAPSRDPFEGAVAPTVLAALGFIGVAPDYIGMVGFGAPSPPGTFEAYLVGEQAALGSLDALRAAAQALTGLPGAPRAALDQVVILGGSQGGHAALFTERYQPYYAPELELVGVVAAVPPTDLLGLATWATTSWGPTAQTLPFALAAMRSWYGHPEDMTSVLVDDGPLPVASLIDELMATECGFDPPDDLDTLEELYPAAVLASGSAGRWEELAPWGCYLRENSIATTSVPRVGSTPLLVTFAELDDLVYTPVMREDIPRLCAQGYQIEYLECAGLGHTRGALAALPQMLTWLRQRADGEPWVPERLCEVTPARDCQPPAPEP
jgi:predicted esterase